MRVAWHDSPWVTAVFGLAAAILTWSPVLVAPGAGLDASWMTGLNMAAAAGLDHGTQVVYTYGPLGFLEVPMVIDGTLAAAGAVYLLALRAALAASLLYAARRSLPSPAAAGVALVAVAIVPNSVAPLALAAVWCLIALQAEAPPWAGRVVVLCGGALAGLELLVKLNVGLTILLVVAITALALPGPRLRTALGFCGASMASFAIGWFASGQGLGNIDDYARSSFEIVTGYSEALQLDAGEVAWDWAAALALAVAALAAALVASAGLPRRRRVLIVALVALLALALEKYSFVRHDAGHVGAFFGGLCAVLVGLRWSGIGRFLLPLAVAATAAAYAPVTRAWEVGGPLRPATALDQLETLLDPGQRANARAEARAALRSLYGVDRAMLERIGEAPVDARPWEISLIWAYDLNWRPLPVLQDYQAYTPWLDRLDAEALASDAGPRFILRHYAYDGAIVGLEGRFEPFNSPLVTRTLLCRFSPALERDHYQLLERRDDRCGAERTLGSVTADYGETIEVPLGKPGEAVFAAIQGAGPSGIERLRALLYRGAVRRIDLGSVGRAFLAPRNAADGLLLVAPAKASYEPPWVLAPNAQTIAIESDGGFATSEDTVLVRFFALPLR